MNIRMFSQQNSWASTNDGGLLHTQDGGLTWTQAAPSGVTAAGGTFFLDDLHAWFSSSQAAQAAPAAGTLYRTADGGKTWQTFTMPFQEGLFQFLDANNGVAIADMGASAGNLYFRMFRTTNGGQTWDLMHIKNPYGFDEVFPTSMPPGMIHVTSGDGFKFQDASTIWFGGGGIVSSKYADLYVSRDAGLTWKHLQLPLPEQKADSGAPVVVDLPTFFNPMDGLFAARYEGAASPSDNPYSSLYLATYVTHDGGSTWEVNPGLLKGVDNLDKVDFISLSDAFVPCGDNLCATHDGGKTWQTISSNLHFLSGQYRILGAWNFADTRTGWAAINLPDGSSVQIYKTTDGGANWSLLQTQVTASIR